MDCHKIKVEMNEEELLERLVITEEEDKTGGVIEIEAENSSVVNAQSCSEESPPKKEEEHAGQSKNEEDVASETCLKEQSMEKQQTQTDVGDGETGKIIVCGGNKSVATGNMTDGQNKGDSRRDGLVHDVMRITEKPAKPSDTEDENVKENDPKVDKTSLNASEQQLEEKDQKKAHRLTPDFPEALYDLLCTFQEGRRLNDQRCSFTLESSGVRRRRCHSEPNTTKPANRVVFSSMTSLQKEEFFEFVATSQARRLNDQRAKLERAQPAKSKGRSLRGSMKQLSFVRKPVPIPAPVPVPKEDLYNLIFTTQAQGRLEDQRSRAPGPMDDEDFFSLLLSVQGGRMDDQRTALPGLLQT